MISQARAFVQPCIKSVSEEKREKRTWYIYVPLLGTLRFCLFLPLNSILEHLLLVGNLTTLRSLFRFRPPLLLLNLRPLILWHRGQLGLVFFQMGKGLRRVGDSFEMGAGFVKLLGWEGDGREGNVFIVVGVLELGHDQLGLRCLRSHIVWSLLSSFLLLLLRFTFLLFSPFLLSLIPSSVSHFSSLPPPFLLQSIS